MNILLDFVMPVTAIEPTAQAATGFLKQALAVVKPKVGVTPGTITMVTSQSQIAAITDNLEVQQLFNAGMNRLYLLAVADLGDIVTAFPGHENEFFTIIISSDFTLANFNADLDVGTFQGVVAISGTDNTLLEAINATKNRSGFHTDATVKAKNMFFAFGKLLSNPLNWKNQQYIPMPFSDDVDTLGEANALFDDKISFVLKDDQYGARLGLFAVGGKAIVAPYVIKNLQLDVQSAILSYIAANQPPYTNKEAALLEAVAQKVVDSYIEREWIEDGVIEISLREQNWVAAADINVAEPNALWRVFAEMQQTL